MAVDQTDPNAISHVMVALRQKILDAGTGHADVHVDAAAQRLTALALFDIGIVLNQPQVEPDPTFRALDHEVLEAAVAAFTRRLDREPDDHQQLLDWLRSLDK